MKTNDFLAKTAKAAFAFATVMMMSMAFAACSGSDDDDNGGGDAVPSQTLMLDGMKKEVKSVELFRTGDNDFKLLLHLSENHEDFMEIRGNTASHNGKTIDLTKQEENIVSSTWGVNWGSEGRWKFIGFGRDKNQLFKTGTMKVNINLETGDYEVVISNGKVQNVKDDYHDGNEHTIKLNWKGTTTVK